MKKVLEKIVAVLITFLLVGPNLICDVTYATNELIQDVDIEKQDVVFNATINNLGSTISDISKEAVLNLDISVNNTGYLKNIKVNAEGNSFEFYKTADEMNKEMITDSEITAGNRIIKSIKGNIIELNEVEAKDKLQANIPIKFNKKTLAIKDDFEEDVYITMSGIFVNGIDKEKEITITKIVHVKWDVEAEVSVSQKLVRYLKYDNKTIVSFEVENGIKENKIPAIMKELAIRVPTINNEQPAFISTTGENISREYTNGILTITKNITPDKNNKYSWNSYDKFIVTYIYNTQSEDKTLNTNAETIISTITGEKIKGDSLTNEFNTNEEVGSIVKLETELPKEINKGYMYTNLNRKNEKINTDFRERYVINIGYAELTDKIEVKEKAFFLTNENNKVLVNGSNIIKTKNVEIGKEELISILGEEGYITVKNEQEQIVGIINKDNTEIQTNSNNLSFETSKPIKEGNLNLIISKCIVGDNSIRASYLTEIKQLLSEVEIKGYKENYEISESSVKNQIAFTEPTSNASFDINTNTLSTVTGNNDVVFNVVLNRTDISDALYVNPKLKITLPNEVTNINVKSAKVIYDDEIKAGNIDVNENEISIALQGIQTQYNRLTTTKGTVIRIVADLGLNVLAPSNNTTVTLQYSNDFTSENRIIEKDIKVVAPSQFITTNEISIDGKNVVALENDEKTIKIKTNEGTKQMHVGGQLVNNTGEKASGVEILGRIPSAKNKTIGGKELNSTINTALITPIEVTGIENVVIYYSNNVEEPLNGEGWQTNYTSDTKSFKITSQDGMNDKQIASFKYLVEVPENIDYEQSSRINYGVYYNNNSPKGTNKNLIESKVAGIETGIAPAIRIGISAIDTNQGYAIDEGGNVTEGEFITYRVKVANIGSFDAENVKVKAHLPNEIVLVNKSNGTQIDPMKYYVFDKTTKQIEHEMGTIAGGESKVFEFTTQINQIISNISEENRDEKNRIKINFEVSSNILENSIVSNYTVKNNSGNLSLKLTSDADEYIEKNDRVNYLVRIENTNLNNKENVSIKLDLPKGMEYDSISSDYENSVKYNAEKNNVEINIGKLESSEIKLIRLTAQNKFEDNGELKTEASAICDGINEEVKSNTVLMKSQRPKDLIETIQTVSNSNNNTDLDEIELYTDIANKSLKKQTIVFENNVQKELDVLEYKVTIDGEQIRDGKTNYIREVIDIPAGKTAKVTIKVKPYRKEQGETINVENKPIITTANGEEIETNNVSLTINGTEEKQTNELVEQGNIKESLPEQNEQYYKINGTAWIDKNKNGKRDLDESKLNGIKVKLYDSSTMKMAKRENGEEIETSTNEDGEYLFSNIQKGKYIVIAFYNNNEYEISDYKADGVEESINSDFVIAKLDNTDIAATEIIDVSEENIQNIDLGVARIDRFDLIINQSITKVTVINNEKETKTFNYDDSSAKIELAQLDLRDSTVLIEYNIKVINNSDVPGYAKTIMNYMPKGMTFNSEINPEWYLGNDGNLYTVGIANEKINPGESKDIKLVLTKKINVDGSELFRGKTEILNTYNERGLIEISAAGSNMAGNLASSDVIIVRKSKAKSLLVIGITIIFISMLGFAGYEVKKHVLDKLYKYDNTEM